MATSWADVVAAAMVQIDDARLQEQLSVSPAQFYRRMAGYVKQAIPLMSRPPELREYLTSGTVYPAWDDFEWVSTDGSAEGETVVETGRAGYELCSVARRAAMDNGETALIPYSGARYDAETGDVTFPAQDAAGLDYELDFYTDGTFPTLTDAQARLFALAVAQVWNERFSNNWLDMTPKIHDESFETVNEANYQDKNSVRLSRKRVSFNDELRKYEQDCAFAASQAKAVGSAVLV